MYAVWMQSDDEIPNPETLASDEAQLWRAAFAVACLMNHLDTSENRSTEAWASSVADGTLRLYRRICKERASR